MADMVACRGCEQQIHKTAAACPHCGASQRSRGYKSKATAGVLAIFLGWLGVHRFYLGQWWGVFYLLLCWTLIPGLVALVEGVSFLTRKQETWDDQHNFGMPASSGEGANTPILILLIVGAGLFAMTVIGILAAIAIPASQDYATMGRLQEGTDLSNLARTALGSECSEASLGPHVDNAWLGLKEPTQYGQGSKVVNSIEVKSPDADTGIVIVTLHKIGTDAIEAGSQVTYTGECGASGMTWTVSANPNFPEKFLSRMRLQMQTSH